MNYSEQIHDFLDGTLEQAEEEELLSAIARQSDLREELRQAIALKSAFKADFQALTPPLHLTNSIFIGLGFAAPGVAAPSVAAPSVAAPVSAALSASSSAAGTLSAIGALGVFLGQHGGRLMHIFQNSLFTTVFTAVVSSLLTAALLVSWYSFAIQNGSVFMSMSMRGERTSTSLNVASQSNAQTALQTTLQQAVSNALPHTFEAIQPAETKPTSTSTSSTSNDKSNQRNNYGHHEHNDQAHEHYPAQQDTHLEINEPDDASLFPIPSHSQSISESPFASSAMSTQHFPTPNALSLLTPEPIPMLSLLSVTDTTTIEHTFWRHLQIGIRGTASISLPQATIGSNQPSFLRNTALSALYQLSEQHLIGIEVGEEGFSQRFRAMDSEGQAFDIQQHPSLLWAGIAYRYIASPTQNFSPILHVVLGGTQIGATGRVMAGLNYAPDARTQFTLGIESSVLVYPHQHTWYASPKIGITYGVSLRF
jgi:hypothetical protein